MNEIKAPINTTVPLRQTPRIDSESLFAGKQEVLIVHQGEEYRLRITKQQKLILTK